MVRPWISALVWLAASGVSSTLGAKSPISTENDGKTATGSFIIECTNSNDVEKLANDIKEAGGEVLKKFNSRFFYGLSVGSIRSGVDIKALAEGCHIEPNAEIKLELERDAGEQLQRNGSNSEPLQSRDTENYNWHLEVTQIDKMHKEGFTGTGIKVAIVDTGVDYTHEALGGCFGPGCRVAFGHNFADDGKKGDPMDCHGHGTFLAGLVGGKSLNYTGAAPSATLMAYRVYDCNGTGSVGSIMEGWLKAAEEGAHIIVSAVGHETSWSQDLLARTVARIAASGVVCVSPVGNSPRKGPFYAVNPSTGRGVISVSAFDPKFVGGLSSYGPTWDLDIKPSLGAPGVEVPYTIMRDESCQNAREPGTSLAAPIVAGVAAIVAQSLGDGSNGTWTFNSTEVRGRLMSTAKPKHTFGRTRFTSVIQQGGGLINAWDAAHTTTIVDPPSLAFNDTDHRVASISLRITNKAKSEVTYQLSSQHATTLYTAELRPSEPDPIRAKAITDKADIKISKDSFVLGPGASETIEVTATDPSDLDLERLPIWSGWVIVSGTDGTSLSIPYLAFILAARTDAFVFNDPQNGQKPGPSNSVERKDAGESLAKASVAVHVPLASPRLRLDIVPLTLCSSSPGSKPQNTSQAGPDLSQACVPNEIITEFAGTKSIGQLPGSPFFFVARRDESENIAHWDGSFAPGQYAPPGRLTNEFSIAYKHNIKP
ncbi:subtilisin-like serine protease PR1C [Metarhizium guizhouense ARSEF 977]|uniref:Subtilisin-like serine protease PR1C n=1 Tax=Metarhizium guizhouense (strain ARSEF 977) TaxID=1276136 RepID=A0A0B4GM97_METGA|nr:subtilisin-like serine protease PR1C [Metarhizium guizhouense ARSEF 977]